MREAKVQHSVKFANLFIFEKISCTCGIFHVLGAQE